MIQSMNPMIEMGNFMINPLMDITLARNLTVLKKKGSENQRKGSKLSPLKTVLIWFEVLGYTVLSGSDLTSGKFGAARNCDRTVILRDRLHQALQRINPNVSEAVIAAAMDRLSTGLRGDLFQKNHQFHGWLTEGIPIHDQRVWLLDRVHLLQNDWLVVEAFPVSEGDEQACLDLVVFINGLPLAVIQGINQSGLIETLQDSYQFLHTCKRTIPTFLIYNALLAVTNGEQARVGTLTSRYQEFMPWLTIDGEDVPVTATTELACIIHEGKQKRKNELG